MKKLKRIACLFLALAMMLSLAACGSFEAKMAKAAKKMEKLQSYRMDMTLDLSMVMSLLGQSMDLSMGMNGTTDVNTDPERTRMEFDIDMMGDKGHVISYSETDGDKSVSFVSQDGGETWTRQSVDRGEISGVADKNDLRALLKLAGSFEKSGTETVRGSEATVFSGTIQGEDIDKAVAMSGVLNSVYENMGISADDTDIDLSDCGSVPTTIAIDNKTGMIVRYTMDLTEVMRNLMPLLMDKTMSAVYEQVGMGGIDLSALGFEIEVGKVFTTVELYDFDAVGQIVIPDAARAAAELAPAA